MFEGSPKSKSRQAVTMVSPRSRRLDGWLSSSTVAFRVCWSGEELVATAHPAIPSMWEYSRPFLFLVRTTVVPCCGFCTLRSSSRGKDLSPRRVQKARFEVVAWHECLSISGSRPDAASNPTSIIPEQSVRPEISTLPARNFQELRLAAAPGIVFLLMRILVFNV